MTPLWTTLLLLVSATSATAGETDLGAKRREAEQRIATLAASVLKPLCGERCSLLSAGVTVKETQVLHDNLPGFEEYAVAEARVAATEIRLAVAVDADFNEAFRSALVHALTTGLASEALVVRVELQPVPMPAAKAVPPLPSPPPTVITLDRREPSAPAAPPLDLRERLMLAVVEAAPWLVALALALGFLALLVRRRFEPRREAEVPAGSKAITGSEPSSCPPPVSITSRLVARCREQHGLTLAVLYRALTTRSPAVVARYVEILGEECLEEFVGCSAVRPQILEVYAALRSTPPMSRSEQDVSLAELERLILAEGESGDHHEEFSFLYHVDVESFASAARSLGPAERNLVLQHAPVHLRRAYLDAAAEGERLAFLQACLPNPGEVSVVAVADVAAHTEALCRCAGANAQAFRRAAAFLNDEVEALDADQQRALLSTLSGVQTGWCEVIEEEVVTEADLTMAPDAVLENLIVTVAPDSLAVFFVGCSADLKARLKGKLPRYVADEVHRLVGRATSEERLRAARRAVFRTFKTLAPAKERVAWARGTESNRAKVVR